MIVIVDNVTLKDEEDSKATVVKTTEGIEQDIKELLRYVWPTNGGLLRLLTTL